MVTWKEKLKKFAKKLLFVLLFLGVGVVFYFAKIDNDISPFLTCYLLCCLFVKFDYKFKNNKLKYLILLLIFTLTQLYFIFTNPNIEKALVGLLVGYIFLSALYISIQTYFKKRLSTPWTIEQIVSLLLVLIVFSLGLACIQIPLLNLSKFVIVLVILVGVYFADPKSTIVLTAVLSLGVAFATGNLIYVADYVLLSISCYCFIARIPIYSFIAMILTDFVIAFYFGGYPSYNLFVRLANTTCHCDFFVTAEIFVAVFCLWQKYLKWFFGFQK
jgi:hypothetical protein